MANPWVIFEQLINKNRRTIGQVQSTNATTGRINVLQVGDDTPVYVEANGTTYTDGSYVFIEGGIVTGQATGVRTVVTELLS